MLERPSVGGLERSFTTGGNAFFVSAVTEAGMFERPPVDGRASNRFAASGGDRATKVRHHA